MRLENNMRPESKEGIQILNEEVDNSDLGRLERFKRWAKDNLLGLSAVAISIAGILTTIVIAGAKAVGSLGKSLLNIGKNFGALISSLLNLVGSILAWGAKGINFLEKNLWILTLAITFYTMNINKEERNKKFLLKKKIFFFYI